jgi:hypothetical protein
VTPVQGDRGGRILDEHLGPGDRDDLADRERISPPAPAVRPAGDDDRVVGLAPAVDAP